jgi:hypothetical protein
MRTAPGNAGRGAFWRRPVFAHLPRGSQRDSLVIADGFSCKTQIEPITDRRALHTAQVLKLALDHGPEGPAGNEPERRYPDVEAARVRRGPVLAGAAAVAAAGGAALWASRR